MAEMKNRELLSCAGLHLGYLYKSNVEFRCVLCIDMYKGLHFPIIRYLIGMKPHS